MKLKSLLFPLILAFAAWAGTTRLPAASRIRSLETFRSASADVVHSGAPATLHGLEASTNLTGWELLGATTEELPGVYRGKDRGAMHHNTRFYRIAEGHSPAVYDWMTNYPISYPDGAEADPAPQFNWTPFPMAASYRMEVFEAIPDGDGGLAPILEPVLSRPGLAAPFYSFVYGDANLAAGGRYLYRVTAEMGGWRVPGRFVPFTGHGVFNSSEGPMGAIFVPAGEGTGGTDWKKVFEMLKKLQEQMEAIREALAKNPLVEEAALYEQLIQIIKNHGTVLDALKALLEGNTDALTDPDTVIKALCYLEKLLNFLSTYDTKMTAAQKEALKNLAQRVAAIKQALENATDKAAALQDALAQLRALMEALAGDTSGVLDYLKDALKEKLLEKLKAMLAKKLGEKAAGALISILTDLINLGDATINIQKLEDLRREFNRILLEAIRNDNTSVNPGRTYTGRIPESMGDCNVTISYKKRCWKRTPGGGEYDGTWEESSVPFSDGSTSKTEPVSRLWEDITSDGRIVVKFRTQLDPAGLRCPNGAGPCIVICEVTYTCPNGRAGLTVTLFVGVFKC